LYGAVADKCGSRIVCGSENEAILITKQIKQVSLWSYLAGYYGYLASALYFAWGKLGWDAIFGMYGIYQTFIAMAWPVWLASGYWPLLP
jgi:hypothetical protein